ncbi:hypothetical protein GQ600_22479 [Phytophthora cactorum]|nr:hypothetical protein GQ600_22479 [Phytophthora cactorum]
MARTFAGRLEIKGSYGPVERLHVSYAGEDQEGRALCGFFRRGGRVVGVFGSDCLGHNMDFNICACTEEMKKAATARHKAKAAANRPTIQSGQPQIGMSNSQGGIDLMVYLRVMILTLSCL